MINGQSIGISFTVFVNFTNDFLQRIFAELVTQHGQYCTYHISADTALFFVIEGIESFLQHCIGILFTILYYSECFHDKKTYLRAIWSLVRSSWNHKRYLIINSSLYKISLIKNEIIKKGFNSKKILMNFVKHN